MVSKKCIARSHQIFHTSLLSCCSNSMNFSGRNTTTYLSFLLGSFCPENPHQATFISKNYHLRHQYYYFNCEFTHFPGWSVNRRQKRRLQCLTQRFRLYSSNLPRSLPTNLMSSIRRVSIPRSLNNLLQLPCQGDEHELVSQNTDLYRLSFCKYQF